MMLALKLGRTLAELGRTMYSAEFSLWIELYQEDLWGELRDYERAGVIAATVANYAGMMRAQGTDPLRPSDFMPRMRGQSEPPEEVVEEPDPVAFFTAVSKSMNTNGR
jgi:hypothetical protein